MQQVQNGVITAAREHADAYRDGHERPLVGYATVLALFGSFVAAAAGLASATGRKLPSGVSPWEVVLLAAGTHKLSRTVSRSAVTSPLRAPFTRYTGTSGPSEVMEEARSTSGPRHVIAELITCPFCLDMWVATGFTVGLVFAPRLTRLVAGALTVLTGADFLHLAYAAAQRATSAGRSPSIPARGHRATTPCPGVRRAAARHRFGSGGGGYSLHGTSTTPVRSAGAGCGRMRRPDPGGTHREERVREEVTGLSLIETDPVVLARGTADLIAVG